MHKNKTNKTQFERTNKCAMHVFKITHDVMFGCLSVWDCLSEGKHLPSTMSSVKHSPFPERSWAELTEHTYTPLSPQAVWAKLRSASIYIKKIKGSIVFRGA